MSIFDFISVSQKRAFLESSRESLALELAQILIRLGIDPEVFSLENFNINEYEQYGETAFRIAQIKDAIDLTNAKLANLG